MSKEVAFVECHPEMAETHAGASAAAAAGTAGRPTRSLWRHAAGAGLLLALVPALAVAMVVAVPVLLSVALAEGVRRAVMQAPVPSGLTSH